MNLFVMNVDTYSVNVNVETVIMTILNDCIRYSFNNTYQGVDVILEKVDIKLASKLIMKDFNVKKYEISERVGDSFNISYKTDECDWDIILEINIQPLLLIDCEFYKLERWG